MTKHYIMDMDGVLVRGKAMVPGADAFLERLLGLHAERPLPRPLRARSPRRQPRAPAGPERPDLRSAPSPSGCPPPERTP